MSKSVYRREGIEASFDAYRRIIYVEKKEDEQDSYIYRVINTNGGLVCPVKTCTEEQVKLLPMVFSTDVCNFQVVDGVLQLGWTEKALDSLSELVKNIHEMKQAALAVKENVEYETFQEEDEEGNWDDNIPLEERFSNPSSKSIDFSHKFNG